MSAASARLEAERLARGALPVADPAGALVMAQLATAHAVLALVDQLTPQQREEKDTREGESTPELVVYRAGFQGHDIPLGLYTTREAARAHCEAEERRTWSTGSNVSFAWIPDDSDPLSPEELSVFAGQNEESVTGYVVTPLEVASKYDEGADG